MAKGARGGKLSQAAGTSIPLPQIVAQPPNMQTGPVSFSNFDDQDAADLRSDMGANYDDPDVVAAIKQYISNSNPNKDGYSHSQNLNYKLDNKLPLNATEKYIDDNIRNGMHAIGKDSNLTRFAHDDFLKAAGIQDYTKMSQAQLQSALVGRTVTTTSYLSTTYDAAKSPFAPGQPQGGGREVVMNIKAGRNTPIVFGSKRQRELIIDKGVSFRVTGVRYDGTHATPRNGGTKPRIVIDIETY